MITPEALARRTIDELLTAAGWAVQDRDAVSIYAARGVAVREFQMGRDAADYLLFVDRQAVGVVEAKKEGWTLTGVEQQARKYSEALPDWVQAPVRPLPFHYQSTGVETRFTNLLDPEPRSRAVFAFHKPATLADWLSSSAQTGNGTSRLAAEHSLPYDIEHRGALRERLQTLPPLDETGLWPAQIAAVRNLERSLQEDRPRALIQMATGSGKTFTAISSIYRLIKYGGAQRALFLVDRANLGRQAYKEFQSYVAPDDGRKFTELYNVQLLRSNQIDPVAKVCITTIQRLYAMLRGVELDPELEEGSQFDTAAGLLGREPVPVVYNPAIPIETFDVIFTDEAHRSIYNLWRQVLEYFDAYLIGLTATPSKQTFGFFNQNLVMEYGHQQAVADGVNVDFNVYKIRTAITEHGATIEAGLYVDRRDRLTRSKRWEQLDENLAYAPNQLDRDVVAVDQIRTVIRTFRERLFTEIFPGRTEVPKTLIFAKDDSHADDIVQIVREEFGKGNDFCQKITYKTTGAKPEDLLQQFRNSYNPRIVVTVDMIATGTDIKPLEIVMFMRAVRSRNFFEQMKGRGVRVIDPDEFQGVTPDARNKTHFVLIDCVGVTDLQLSDSQPVERDPTISFQELLNRVAFGSADADTLSSLASRLARLDRQLGKPERERLEALAGGLSLHDIASGIVEALDADRQAEHARELFGLPPEADPEPDQLQQAARELLEAAALPLAANPALRNELVEVKRRFEQTIDTLSQDELLEAGFSIAATERARTLTASFEQYITDNKDAITALQVLYSRPYGQRLRFEDIKELAAAIAAPPRAWTPEQLWHAYETLDSKRVRGSAGTTLTNLVALVRFALHQEEELRPYPEQVAERFELWLTEQQSRGRAFTPEQLEWLALIRDQVAASLGISLADFDYAPFFQRGGLGGVYQSFGDELPALLEELNRELAA